VKHGLILKKVRPALTPAAFIFQKQDLIFQNGMSSLMSSCADWGADDAGVALSSRRAGGRTRMQAIVLPCIGVVVG
jgi:hypothetical protein